MSRRVAGAAFSMASVAALSIALVGGWPVTARAFCRLTTVKPDPGEACASAGLAAVWQRSCISFSVLDPGSALPPLEQVRDVADTSFATWEDVSCNGKPIGFKIAQTEQLAQCAMPRYNKRAPNANTVAFLADWSDFADMSPDAFGLTMVAMDQDTGEIYDADMVLNEELGPLRVCDGSCAPGVVDLQNVMTHEAGHFFGLGHSNHPDATVSAVASVGETQKRTLAADDIAGICAIYGQRAAPSCKPADFVPRHGFSPECAAAPIEKTGCQCFAVGPGARAAATQARHVVTTLLLAAFALIALRRRRRPR